MKSKSSSTNPVYAEPHSRGHLPSENPDRPFHDLRKTVHNALAIISLRRWLFFFPFCIAVAGVFIASISYPRTFTASTRFERRDDPVLMDLPVTEGTGSFSYFRQTLERDMTAPEVMSRVVEKLGLGGVSERDETGAPTEAWRTRLESMGRSLAPYITISSRERTPHLDLVEIRYTGPDSTIGPRLVDEIRQAYVERTQVRIRQMLESKREWYDQRLSDATQRLMETQKRLALLRMENPYVEPGSPGMLNDHIDDLTSEHRALELQRKSLEIDLRGQEELLRSTQMHLRIGGAANPSLAAVSGVLLSAQAIRIANHIKSLDERMEELRSVRGMKAEHPDMAQLIGERVALEQRLQAQRLLDEEAASGLPNPQAAPESRNDDPILVQWRQEHDRVNIQIDSLQQRISEVDTRLTTNDERMARLRTTKSQLFEKHEEYSRYMGELDLAGGECNRYRDVLQRIEPVLAANEQGRAVTFTEETPASGSTRPISPEARTIFLVALMVGVCVGVLCVVLAEVSDHVFRSSHQVARTIGLSILETIDVIVTSADRRKLLVHKMVLVPAGLVLGLSVVLVSGAASYLSVTRPADYQRWIQVPRSVWEKLVCAPEEAQPDPQPADPPTSLAGADSLSLPG